MTIIPRWIVAGPKRLLTSARFWILTIFAFVLLLIVYYAVANRYTPYTNDAYVQSFVIQVAPRIEGQVIRVYVSENQKVHKGDILFEIDPRPFEHNVRRLEASHEQNRQLVAQMESELKAARAEEAKIDAEQAFAKAVFEQESAIFQRDATTERKFLDAKQRYQAVQAMSDRARADVRKREQALAARLGDEHVLVAEVKAQLANAYLDLEWTKVYAPVNGYITNLQLQPGAYAHVGQAVLTCIDSDDWWIVANYRENNLEYMREGMPAEVAFKTYPGRVLPARVVSVGWGVAQGQGVPSGTLPGVTNPTEWVPAPQRFQVRLVLINPESISPRVGATGSATVYTTPDHGLNGLAEIWQRLSAWLNFLR